MKRLFDILFSLVGLALLAVPFAVIAPVIKLSSRGPVFYRQQRIGRGGKPFWLYKFRTMYVEAEGGSFITVEGDRRITPVGRVLRRWKFDELPQLWNVLTGDMSVIGPRPEVERYVSHYTPEQRRLLQQTPGLAGVSQLVYPTEANILRHCFNPEEFYIRELMPKKIAVDLEYEVRRTFWSDLRLLLEMVLLVLGKSYRVDQDFCVLPAQKNTSGRLKI
jgi:lipopolysaccharide/colanic/teichoic acid biosynthesis glycosyltransferase